MSDVIHVAVAAIVNTDNEVLISQRAERSHQGGLWEFPGGKREKNETIEQALLRECHEELGIQLRSYRPLVKVPHQYPDKTVLLDVWKVDDFEGQPTGLEGQPVRWHPVSRLGELKFPEADIPVIRALNLPENYLITGQFDSEQQFESRLLRAIESGIKLIQLRLTNKWLDKEGQQYGMKVVESAVQLSEQYDFTLMFNLPDVLSDSVNDLTDSSNGTYGIHLNSNKLLNYNKKPTRCLMSASCHNLRELQQAQKLAADFLVLSPVQATASHPDTTPLGWNRFSEMIDEINIPVYALGGVKKDDTKKAWAAGGQGVAAIRNFWEE